MIQEIADTYAGHARVRRLFHYSQNGGPPEAFKAALDFCKQGDAYL